MSNDLNQCNFIGRLGRDVEVRYQPSGDAVAKFTIAVGWKSKDKDGAEWVPVVCFGKLAEVCGKYLSKGSRVFVSGKFVTRQWEKDGKKHYATEIRCNEMQMLDSARSGGDQSQARRQEPQSAPAMADEGFSEPPFDEDIPF